MRMQRIIMHWTAGVHSPSSFDKSHYHFLVDGKGQEHAGRLPPEANISTRDGQYVAHTRMANTGSIGIAICAMAGAQERPFSWGAAPILPAQVDGLCRLAARLARQYEIPCRRDTILSHAEVQITLGVAQAGKWDIAVLPGMDAPGNPVDVGDELRERIARMMAGGK